MNGVYGPQFFADIAGESERSAKVIVPHFYGLIQPRSVIDIGCGKGYFLREFAECGGVETYLGLDGAPADDQLVIPAGHYEQIDLASPTFYRGRFDLAISLEVAEHLPESAAENFIANICRHADVVLFSAAIPMQGGEGHIHEAWPEHWINLFGAQGYRVSGWPRIEMWNDERVSYWYRQNSFLFQHLHAVGRNDTLDYYFDSSPVGHTERLVHPELFGNKLGVKFT